MSDLLASNGPRLVAPEPFGKTASNWTGGVVAVADLAGFADQHLSLGRDIGRRFRSAWLSVLVPDSSTIDFHLWLVDRVFDRRGKPVPTLARLRKLGSGTATAGAVAAHADLGDGAASLYWPSAMSWTLDANGIEDVFTNRGVTAPEESAPGASGAEGAQLDLPDCLGAAAIAVELVHATNTGNVFAEAYT